MSRIIRAAAMCAAALLVSAGATGVAVAKPKPPAPQTSWYFQGFEQNTAGWNDDITRVADGYSNGGGYADGIDSAFGTHHARVGTPDGAYFDFTGIADPTEFPEPGYVTNLDVYLDTSWAMSNLDKRVDVDQSSWDNAGNWLQDFVFDGVTTPAGFVFNSATNGGRSGANPLSPCPSPNTPPDNSCRVAVTISQSGWYSFRHTFRDVDGKMAVRMQILDHQQHTVADWTIVSEHPAADFGGPNYIWFPAMEIDDLAIDDTVYAPLQPQNKEDCKDGRWAAYSDPSYKNQGACEKAVKPAHPSH